MYVRINRAESRLGNSGSVCVFPRVLLTQRFRSFIISADFFSFFSLQAVGNNRVARVTITDAFRNSYFSGLCPGVSLSRAAVRIRGVCVLECKIKISPGDNGRGTRVCKYDRVITRKGEAGILERPYAAV